MERHLVSQREPAMPLRSELTATLRAHGWAEVLVELEAIARRRRTPALLASGLHLAALQAAHAAREVAGQARGAALARPACE